MQVYQSPVGAGFGRSAELGVPFDVKGVLNMANGFLKFRLRMPDRLMRDSPHRIEGRGISGQAWDDVPVDVRELVAEEFVVDLLGIIDLYEYPSDGRDVFHQLHAF